MSPSGSKLGGLRFEDVVVSNGTVHIRMQCSKMEFFGCGEWLPLHASGLSSSCSIRLSEVYPMHADGSPETRYQFSVI